MNHTQNYQLNQWEPEDKVRRTDFNADNARLDAALSGLAAADGAINTALSGKADQSALDTLSAQVSRRGNCQLYVTSYVGNGKFHQENARTLTLPKPPQFVFITEKSGGAYSFLVRGMEYNRAFGYNTYYTVRAIWQGNKFTWYSDHDATAGMNAENSTYHLVALLAADQ